MDIEFIKKFLDLVQDKSMEAYLRGVVDGLNAQANAVAN